MSRRRNAGDGGGEFIEVVSSEGEIPSNSSGGSGNFFEDNQMMVIGAAALIGLIVCAYFAYKFLYKAPREKEATEQIYKAEQQFLKDSFALALEAPGGGYDGFLDIIDNYGGTKTGNIAKYYAGISYLNLGRFEDAISYLNSYNESGNVTSITKYGALGDAYSELGDVSKALSSYSKATSKDVGVLTPYYLHKLGILSYREGDNDQAAKAFNRLKSEFPSAPEAEDASKYLGMLN